MDETQEPLPFWHRSRFRWINGMGFAMSAALVLIAVLGLLQSLLPNRESLRLTFPAIYAVVTYIALLATIGLFAWLMVRVAWRGERFDTPHARRVLYFWSLAGLLFWVCLAIVAFMFDRPDLPNVPTWAADFLWFACPFGLVTFGLMAWTNSELPHDDPYHADDHDAEYDDYDVEDHHGYDEHDLEDSSEWPSI